MACCGSKTKVAEPTRADKKTATTKRQKTPKPDSEASFSERLPVLLGGRSSKKPKEDEKDEKVEVQDASSSSSSLLPSFLGGSSTEKPKEDDEKVEAATDNSSSSLLPSFLGGSSTEKPKEDEKIEAAQNKSSSSLLPSFLSGSSKEKPKKDETTSQAADSSAAGSSDITGGNMLGALVQKIVKSYDEKKLGVKVRMDSMAVLPVSGGIEIRGLYVDNPEGYKSPYMLRADKLLVKVSMMKLMGSFGNTIDITEIDLYDVDANFEKSLTTSNINDLLKKLDAPATEATDTNDAKNKKDDPKVSLHKISVCNIGAKVCTNIWPGFGPRLAVGDITYEDFEKETGGPAGMMDVIVLVAKTLLKSIIASIIGRSAMGTIVDCATCSGQGASCASCGSGNSDEQELVVASQLALAS
ncbi:unnamed protein product [Polarella glacialis]|uniref:Uncharacterized protein n=1 Tax=Polarella glacialis TaxID=89957 RepID=A0A813D9M1_POLGL|nr:unnamed protein product [Polarella glacialis]CAE8623031.1 unnamed protein product [Polarella glacialis]